MRTLAVVLLLAGALHADVVVLKDGTRVVGRVVDRQGHYEVVTEQGLRTYLKDEVDRVVASPAEFLGDADVLYEQAKEGYRKALNVPSPGEQNALLREAVAKLSRSREAYAGTRELFPEDKHAVLDQKLMQVMQLMRLLRERVSSDLARPSEPRPSGAPAVPRVDPSGATALAEAFAGLAGAAGQAEPSARLAALKALRGHRSSNAELYDLATAGMLFLARPLSEWKMAGPARTALDEYFARPWIREATRLTPDVHGEALSFLSGKIAGLRASEPPEPLLLFAAGHLGSLGADAAAEKAKALGFHLAAGVPGTPEGLALRDLHLLLAGGEFDLAVRAFQVDHRSLNSAAVRYVGAWALLELAIRRGKGFDRPAAAFLGLRGDAATIAHAQALGRSIQAASPCGHCGGDGWLRCTNCHGQKTLYVICKTCDGARMVVNKNGVGVLCNACKATGLASKLECGRCVDGYFRCSRCKLPSCAACGNAGRTRCASCKGRRVVKEPCRSCGGEGLEGGAGVGAGAGRGGKGAGLGGAGVCARCKGSGNEKIAPCSACPNGFLDCPNCEPQRKLPVLDDICAHGPCADCEGRGLAFRRVAWPCPSCLGLGRRAAPRTEPAKVLPERR